MVHLHFAEPSCRTRSDRPPVAAQELTVGPTCVDAADPHHLEMALHRTEVRHDLVSRATGAGSDVGVALSSASWIAGNILAPERSLEADRVAFCIAGDVGQHVTDGPAGKPAG